MSDFFPTLLRNTGNVRPEVRKMGQRAIKTFENRFHNGIEINFAKQEQSPAEQEYRNKCLRDAIFQIFKGVLGREPTQDELSGRVKISITNRKKRSV